MSDVDLRGAYSTTPEVRDNSGTIINTELTDRVVMARWREAFFTKNTKVIRNLLYKDLKKYVAGSDITRMKLQTLNEFVPGFLKKITEIYNNPIHFSYGEDTSEKDKKNIERLKSQDIIFKRFINRNNRRTRLHGTNLVYVRYNQRFDDIYITHLHEGNSWVVPYPDYIKKPAIVMYRRDIKDKKRYYVWHRDKKEHYYVEEDKPEIDEINLEVKVTSDEKKPIGGNETVESPDYFPFIAYRYDDDYNSFWCNGMDDLIEYTRTINTLLTVSGDDAIQETIKLLLLNFNPTKSGKTEDEESGLIKTGLRHPLYPEDNQSDITGEGNEFSGQVIQGKLLIKEILNYIDTVTAMLCSLENVDNLLSEADMQRVTGEALRLKYSFLEKDWREDVDLLRRYNRELFETIVKINNYERSSKERISDKALENITLEYEKPSIVNNESEELKTEQLKWSSGLSNPVKYLAKKEGISEDEAREQIEENKDIVSELVGTRTTLGMNATQANTEI